MSSQFLSSLLLSLPTLAEPSAILVEGAMVSAPYVEATLAVLRSSGVRVLRAGRTYRIPGGQRYRGRSFRVPGDASSAAYLWAAAALTRGEVRVDGVPARWPQADYAVLDLLSASGAFVQRTGESVSVRGARLRPFRADLTNAPDLYPLAGTLAASIPGRSVLGGGAHARLKESDRLLETARLARAFGARVSALGEGLAIEGRSPSRPVRLAGLTDHRLVMSAAVGALAASGPSEISDGRAVAKSFPGFWDALARLGGEVRSP